MTNRVIKTILVSIWDLLAFQFRRFAVGAWILLVIVCFFAIYRAESAAKQAHTLAQQNAKLINIGRERINDIQKSRVASCKQTYHTIDGLLLLTVKGRHLNPTQQKRFNELRKLVNVKRCQKQVKAAQ